MAFGVPTNLGTILLSIQNQLVNESQLFPMERALITMAIDDEFDIDPISDSFVIFGPTTAEIGQGLVTGGGNQSMEHLGNLTLKLFNRYEAGNTHDDSQALTSATLGILSVWKKVLKSLQLFVPFDPLLSGNAITEEPMRYLRWAVEPRRPRSPWLVIRSAIDCKWIEDLS